MQTSKVRVAVILINHTKSIILLLLLLLLLSFTTIFIDNSNSNTHYIYIVEGICFYQNQYHHRHQQQQQQPHNDRHRFGSGKSFYRFNFCKQPLRHNMNMMNDYVTTDDNHFEGDIHTIETKGNAIITSDDDEETLMLSSVEYHDDFIWILPKSSLSSSSSSLSSSVSTHVVPLLPSTVKLVRHQLRELITVPYITTIDDEVTFPTDDKSSSGKNEVGVDVDQISNDLTTSLQITDTEGNQNNSTDITKEEEDTPLSSPSSDLLLSLTRFTNLSDHIMNTLNDFRTIRRNNATKLGILRQQEYKVSNQSQRRRRGGNGQNNNSTNNNNNNNGRNNGGHTGNNDVANTTPETGNPIERKETDDVDPELARDNINPNDKDGIEVDDDDANEVDTSIFVETDVKISTETSAWYMLIATLNSLRILTPILMRIVWHPQRNNKAFTLLPPSTDTTTVSNDTIVINESGVVPENDLNLEEDDDDDDNDDDDDDNLDDDEVRDVNRSGNNRRGKRSRNAKCYLIGTYVFDQCNVRQCKFIWKNLEHLYYLLGVTPLHSSTMNDKEQEQIVQSYMKIITTTMEHLIIGYGSSITTSPNDKDIDNNNNNKDHIRNTAAVSYCDVLPSSSSLSWLNYHPFDEMDEYDQIKLYMSTKILDQRFHLQINKDSMNPKDKLENDAYLKAIYELHEQLKGMVSNKYPGSRISMYGSCLSDLSLGKNADVDFSLYIEELADTKNDYETKKITEDTYRSIIKKYVYNTCRLLERHRKQRFQNMIPVAHARVPVVKGNYVNAGNPHAPDGSLDFDICFINDIAVSNSELIRQYSLVSDTVKSLMILVKRWAKANHLASTQDNSISSYAWMNLVIYYMQCIGIVPNLQCPKLMKLVNYTTNKDGAYWDNVNFLNTRFVTWEQASTVWSVPAHRQQNMSITALLYGFFDFYAKTFPSNLFMISIATGASKQAKPKTLFHKTSLFWCIEDPFELADSYCPHDLGMHASEPGSALILERLRAAEVYLRTQLLQVLDMDSDETTTFLLDVQSLWPHVKLSSSGKDEPKTNNRGNAPRKVPIRTTGNVEDMNIAAKPEVWPTLGGTTKKAGGNQVKAAPAIAPIRGRKNNNNSAKTNSNNNRAATTIKPIRRPNNNNNNNGKAGPKTTGRPMTTQQKVPRTNTNANNNSAGNKKPNPNNIKPSSNNNINNNNNNDQRRSQQQRQRRPPAKKSTTATSATSATTTSSTTVKTPKPSSSSNNVATTN